MKNALITGITGQDGAYLADFLLKKGYKVYGIVRRTSTTNYWRLEELGVLEKIELIEADMIDQASLNNAVIISKPDEIYNLAAQSFVGTSWKQPILTSEITALGTTRILEAMKQFAPKSRFYQASTSEMYGNSVNNFQDEETKFHPTSPYAISKLYAHWITINYRESYGLFTCCGILFNHESELRGIEFVTRKITDGVAKIKLGLANELVLGNLDSKRDWGYAKDYVEAMWLMLQQDKPDDYVISTGVTHSVEEFVEAAFKSAGIPDWKKYVKQDPRYMRPSELHLLQGKSDKAYKKLGWKPEIKFDKLVDIMVKSDIKRLSKQ